METTLKVGDVVRFLKTRTVSPDESSHVDWEMCGIVQLARHPRIKVTWISSDGRDCLTKWHNYDQLWFVCSSAIPDRVYDADIEFLIYESLGKE